MTESRAEIAAGLAGSATFLATFVGLGWVWWVSLLVTGLVYAGGNLMLGGMLRDRVQALAGGGGSALARLQQQVVEARGEVQRLRSLARGIQHPAIRARLESVCQLAEKIFLNFKQDPDDLRQAHRFLSYFQKVLPIMGQYAHLASDPDRRKVLSSADEALVLETIAAFEQNLREAYRAFQENNLQELRQATGTLKRMIEMEHGVKPGSGVKQ